MASRRLSLPVAIGIVALAALALARSDEIRQRAELGLERGMPAREAALARGFVLGQDGGIDPRTEEDFERSGLSHLLAVSGQNVTLLALLALPLLGALGLPLRERLLWVLALIAVYVPLAGAGPTIQRAALMGAAGIVATLAGRRASRLYALVLAAGVTLAIDPGIGADVGWQLSFAAVLGILLLAAPLRGALTRWLGGRGLRRALAEGIAVTVAATLATAPLIAFHFGTVSTMTLLANVLAMPAVAPAMWLGMASAAAAQVPGAPLELLNVPAAVPLAYIAQVAAWCGRPGWAEIEVELGVSGLSVAYAALALATFAAPRLARRRHLARLRRSRRRTGPRPERSRARHSRSSAFERGRGRWGVAAITALLAACTVAAQAGVGPARWLPAGSGDARAPAGLRVTMFDVGQGDAILLQPRRGAAVLVDGGPPWAGVEEELLEAGVERLGAVVLTHAQSDHAGGVRRLLGRFPIARLLYAAPAPRLLAAAGAAGVRARQVSRGAVIHSGRLQLRVLWPPPELLPGAAGRGASAAGPNHLSVVLVAAWRRFSLLLCGDAEAESVPLDPGPVDVLKVAHHGSEDAGLGPLLDRTRPRLALISAGAGNPYGHPASPTVATLAARGVRVLRTDRDGEIRLEVGPESVRLDG